MFVPNTAAARLDKDLALPLPAGGRLCWPAAVLVLMALCVGLWGVVWLVAGALMG